LKTQIHYNSRALCQKGIRPNNQDAIAPEPNEVDDRSNVYVVCDGVGGASKGEVASRICAKTVADFLGGLENEDFDTELYEEGLRDTEALIERYIAKNPGNESMSTTLTWIRFTENNEAHIGWVGDSRVYHFRNGKILFQTSDHSLVNAMVAAGDLSPEEARLHPKKNVILRAVSGVGEPVEMDFQRIKNIQSGDRFLLCTDGVTDAVSNNDLEKFLASENKLPAAIDHINESCAFNSKDNYSCYLIEVAVKEIEESINEKAERIAAENAMKAQGSKPERKFVTKKAKPEPTGVKPKVWLSIVLSILFLGLIGVYFANQHFEQQKVSAKYDALLSDGELFYQRGAYPDAIEHLEEAERLRALNPVMSTMLDSARIKNLWPVYSDLQISDVYMLRQTAQQAQQKGLDKNGLDGIAFSCSEPKRISGLFYHMMDSLNCKAKKGRVNFNVDMDLPLQIDSNRVVFWTNIPDVPEKHFVSLIVLDETGTEAKVVEFGDKQHYDSACKKRVEQ